MDKNNEKHHYGADLLRFVLILWIVLYHYTYIYNSLGFGRDINYPFHFNHGGTVGVSLFFILSGFFFYKTFASDRYGIKAYGIYIAKRYYRLWLPYFLACLIVFVWLCILPLPGREIGLPVFFLNLVTFVHPGVDYVDGAHWFLADLFVVQALLGILLVIKQKIIRTYCLTTIFVVTAILQFIELPMLETTVQRIFEVSFGIQIYRLYKQNSSLVILLCALGLSVVAYTNMLYLIWSILLILALISPRLFETWGGQICMVPTGSKVSKVSDIVKRILKYLGNISFVWYLVHQNIGYTILFYIIYPCDNLFYILTPIITTIVIAIVQDTILNNLKKIEFKL